MVFLWNTKCFSTQFPECPETGHKQTSQSSHSLVQIRSKEVNSLLGLEAVTVVQGALVASEQNSKTEGRAVKVLPVLAREVDGASPGPCGTPGSLSGSVQGRGCPTCRWYSGHCLHTMYGWLQGKHTDREAGSGEGCSPLFGDSEGATGPTEMETRSLGLEGSSLLIPHEPQPGTICCQPKRKDTGPQGPWDSSRGLYL